LPPRPQDGGQAEAYECKAESTPLDPPSRQLPIDDWDGGQVATDVRNLSRARQNLDSLNQRFLLDRMVVADDRSLELERMSAGAKLKLSKDRFVLFSNKI
jgi:hypothetical protein